MKNKTYTFIDSTLPEKSMCSVPLEYYINSKDLKIVEFKDRGRFYCNYVYGFLIKKSVLDDECKTFYIDDGYSSPYIKRIAFVKLDERITNYNGLSNNDTRFIIKNRSAREDWGVFYVLSSQDSNFRDIPDDSYLLGLMKENKSNKKRRCFETKDDAVADHANRAKKRDAVNKAKMDAYKNANSNGDIILTTPKYKIEKINLKTDYLKGVKVGDVIYGSIIVLKDGENKLNKSSHYVNYIDMYVNDKHYKTFPMNVFGNLLSKYIKLSGL